MTDENRGPYPEMDRAEALLSAACPGGDARHPTWNRYTDRLRRVLVFAAAEAACTPSPEPRESETVGVGELLVGLALEGEQDRQGGSLAAQTFARHKVSSYDIREAAQEPVNEPMDMMTLKVPAGTWRHPIGSFKGWPETLVLSRDVDTVLRIAGNRRSRDMSGPVRSVDFVSPEYVLEAALEDRLCRDVLNAATARRGVTLDDLEATLLRLRKTADTAEANRKTVLGRMAARQAVPSEAYLEQAGRGRRPPDPVTPEVIDFAASPVEWERDSGSLIIGDVADVVKLRVWQDRGTKVWRWGAWLPGDLNLDPATRFRGGDGYNVPEAAQMSAVLAMSKCDWSDDIDLPHGFRRPNPDTEMYVAVRLGHVAVVTRDAGETDWRWVVHRSGSAQTAAGKSAPYASTGFRYAVEAMHDVAKVVFGYIEHVTEPVPDPETVEEAKPPQDPDPHWVRQGERLTAEDMARDRGHGTVWACGGCHREYPTRDQAQACHRPDVMYAEPRDGETAWKGLNESGGSVVVTAQRGTDGAADALNVCAIQEAEWVAVTIPLGRCRGLADMILEALDAFDPVEGVCIVDASAAEDITDQDAVADMYPDESARIRASIKLRGLIGAAFDAGAVWAEARHRLAERNEKAHRQISKLHGQINEDQERIEGEITDHHGQRQRLSDEAALVVWGHAEPSEAEDG